MKRTGAFIASLVLGFIIAEASAWVAAKLPLYRWDTFLSAGGYQ